MKILLRMGRRAVIGLSLLGSSSVFAAQCGQISPILEQVGDRYYHLDDINLSVGHRTSKQVSSVIDGISREKFRAGDGYRTQCFGVYELRTETREFELKSIDTIELKTTGQVVFRADEHEKRVIAPREVVIPLSSEFTRVTRDDAFVSSVFFNQARIDDSGEKFSTLRETTTKVLDVADGVQIKQSIYVNGYLAEWFTWNLR